MNSLAVSSTASWFETPGAAVKLITRITWHFNLHVKATDTNSHCPLDLKSQTGRLGRGMLETIKVHILATKH